LEKLQDGHGILGVAIFRKDRRATGYMNVCEETGQASARGARTRPIEIAGNVEGNSRLNVRRLEQHPRQSGDSNALVL
jgi:hypothetical protein